jgi:D-cysteine desulfhydrase
MRVPEKIPLAHLPTPIVALPRLSRELGKEIYLWRDDVTGFAESGNKIRKLEYLAAEAQAQRATVLVTCGGPQSNHARATAVVARRLGMGVTLVVRKPKTGLDPHQEKTGNALLNRLLGADREWVEFADYQSAGGKYDTFLDAKAERLKARNERPYIIPEGGSCPLGCFGYFTAVPEMLATWAKVVPGSRAPDSLFIALGSGGTYAGLHLGLEAVGIASGALHAVNVCDDPDYFTRRIHGLFDGVAEHFGIQAKERALRLHGDYVGEGYALASDDELRFYAQLARQEGLLLDPCYTGKAFRGMIQEIKKNPSALGKRILFLHSGGTFATFAYADQYARALE